MNIEFKKSPFETLNEHETFSSPLEELAWIYETEFSPDYMIE